MLLFFIFLDLFMYYSVVLYLNFFGNYYPVKYDFLPVSVNIILGWFAVTVKVLKL